jgi:hypothetical protein
MLVFHLTQLIYSIGADQTFYLGQVAFSSGFWTIHRCFLIKPFFTISLGNKGWLVIELVQFLFWCGIELKVIFGSGSTTRLRLINVSGAISPNAK